MSWETTVVDESITHPGTGRYRLIGLLVTAILLIIGIGLYATASCPVAAVCGPIAAADISQGRIDTALPFPRGDVTIEQSFTPDRNGLSVIELILVRTGDGVSDGRLTLELLDDRDTVVHSRELPSQDFAHNQTFSFEFPAQKDSLGRSYRLRLTGNDQNQLTVWGYSLDVVQPGELTITAVDSNTPPPESAAREMRFVTTYQLTAADALGHLIATTGRYIGYFLLVISFLLMPGCLLLMIGRGYRWDSAAWVGAAMALGMAVWPIVWLWFSLVGGVWSGRLLWIVLIAGWIAVLLLWLRQMRRSHETAQTVLNTVRQGDWWVYGLLILLLIASVSVRLLAVRDLAFPPWVDSSRHGLITAVMVTQGQTLTDYQPLLPVDVAPYHYGFHAIAASLSLMTDLPLQTLLLLLGQLINGLLPLTVYAAGWMISRQKVVGLVAAFLVALPFYFPGYYVTWGRMTQLSAMFVLPVLLALTWRVGRGWRNTWILVAILGAGVFLTHLRVFLFFAPFAILVLLLQLVSYRRFRPYVLASALGMVLILPRVIQLLQDTNPLQAVQNSVAGFNDFPTGYFTAGWEQAFIAVAAVGLVVVAIGLWRGRRWAVFPLLLVVWVASLFFLLAGDRLGLPETLLINLNSMVISLFLPLSLFLSLTAVRLWGWGSRLVRPRHNGLFGIVAAVAIGVVIGVLSLFGVRTQIGIVNPQTILTSQQDKDALVWVTDNVPEDALIAVNSWRWLGNTWAAADGGAWLLPLTGREVTTPPIDHIYNPDLFADVRNFNDKASAVTDWADPSAAEWLLEQGVTHVFVGAKGGFLDPAALMRNPLLSPIYQDRGTFIFAINGV